VDVAYLLGMILARRSFETRGEVRTLRIQFPFRLEVMTTLPGSSLALNRERELRLLLDEVRRRVNELLEVNVDVQPLSHQIVLQATFTKNTISTPPSRYVWHSDANRASGTHRSRCSRRKMRKSPASETGLYGPVVGWLQRCLSDRHPRSRVIVEDSHRWPVSRVIRKLGIQAAFPQAEHWDIRVDVVGFVLGRASNRIVLVECKAGPPTLMNVCQLLGYSLVVKPSLAILVSPEPPSDSLAELLRVHGRYDILEYAKGRRLRIAQWHRERGEVIAASVLPPGEYF